MSWTRADLKSRAKTAFKANYWKCVLVALIFTFLAGSGSSNGSDDASNAKQRIENYRNGNYASMNMAEIILDEDFDDVQEALTDAGMGTVNAIWGNPMYTAILGVVGAIAALAMAIGIALSAFVFNPLIVGCQKYFVENERGNGAQPGFMGSAFTNGHYLNTVIGMFLKTLFNFLWTLLLIVPGIVKHYEYRMIPYLLADHPEMSWQDAFKESKRLMDGQKWDTFVLDLSFLGWNILSAITFELVGVFYSNPYQYGTNAELYLTLSGSGANTYGTGTDGYNDTYGSYTTYTEV